MTELDLLRIQTRLRGWDVRVWAPGDPGPIYQDWEVAETSLEISASSSSQEEAYRKLLAYDE